MIQELHLSGASVREIAQMTGKDRKTVKKYLNGDPDILCRSKPRSSMDTGTGYIVPQIKAGKTAAVIVRSIIDRGYDTTESYIRYYVKKNALRYGLELSKYCCTTGKYDADGNKLPIVKYVTRKSIFNHLWANMDLPNIQRDYLWSQHEVLPELDRCMRLFGEFSIKKNIPCLYLFIEKFKESPIRELASFYERFGQRYKRYRECGSKPTEQWVC